MVGTRAQEGLLSVSPADELDRTAVLLVLTGTEYAQAEATSVATQQQGSTEVARLLERTESVDRSNVLSLDNIRQSLIRQEDSIIFSLIERSQFAHNQPVYEADSIPVPGYAESGQRYSLLDYLLQETEQLHGKIRRYTSPDEHPFFPDALPPLVLPPITYSEVRGPAPAALGRSPWNSCTGCRAPRRSSCRG